MSPERSKVAVALVVLAGIGVIGGYGVSMRARPTPVKVTLGPSTSPGPAADAIAVHVAGAVKRPGLYMLEAGSRVADAIEAAGGATSTALIDALNLASPLKDGDKVLVPEEGEGTEGPSDGRLNLNSASASQLEALPGIGPALAQRIIDHRDSIGGFRTVEELLDVSGIGQKTFEQLVDLVSV